MDSLKFIMKDASNTDATYRRFSKESTEDVPADYVVEGDVEGAGIKDTSKAGNEVIRLAVKVKQAHSPADIDVWYRGTLNLSPEGRAAIAEKRPQAKGERPGVWGTLTSKDGQQLKVAGWIRQEFTACVASKPPSEGGDEKGDIPF